MIHETWKRTWSWYNRFTWNNIPDPSQLDVSEQGTTYQVGYKPMAWITPGIYTFVVALATAPYWSGVISDPLAGWGIPGVLAEVGVTLCLPVLAGWAVTAVIQRRRGPLAPRHLWCPEELHDEVVGVVNTLRRYPPSIPRELLMKRLADTLSELDAQIRTQGSVDVFATMDNLNDITLLCEHVLPADTPGSTGRGRV